MNRSYWFIRCSARYLTVPFPRRSAQRASLSPDGAVVAIQWREWACPRGGRGGAIHGRDRRHLEVSGPRAIAPFSRTVPGVQHIWAAIMEAERAWAASEGNGRPRRGRVSRADFSRAERKRPNVPMPCRRRSRARAAIPDRRPSASRRPRPRRRGDSSKEILYTVDAAQTQTARWAPARAAPPARRWRVGQAQAGSRVGHRNREPCPSHRPEIHGTARRRRPDALQTTYYGQSSPSGQLTVVASPLAALPQLVRPAALLTSTGPARTGTAGLGRRPPWQFELKIETAANGSIRVEGGCAGRSCDGD